jgi:pimeloyl-ACP methyl ester carboxylesterase
VRPERRVFAGAAGNRLVADVRGAGGPPVVLLHGGGQTRHAFDAPAGPVADAGFVAVTVDQRGHGDSDWPADGAYAFADYGADALALAGQLRDAFGRPAVSVGASMGGLASLLALGRDPEAFAGLVLVDITPRMDPSGLSRIQGFMRGRSSEGFASLEEAAQAVAAYLPHRPRPPSLEGLRKNLRLHPDGRYRWHWDPRFYDGPRPIDTDGGTLAERFSAAARSLRVPTMLVRGRSSELVTEELAAEFLALVPHADHASIAGARHMVAGDRNTIFAGAVLDFLARRFGGSQKPESDQGVEGTGSCSGTANSLSDSSG